MGTKKDINDELINKCKIADKYKFYFLHSTTFKNLKSMLKTKYIKLGTDPDVKERIWSSGHDSVYLSIYFDDIKNLTNAQNITLLLSSILIFDYKIHFNKGWGYEEDFVIINRKDDNVTSKIKKIRKYLKDPDLPEKIKGLKWWEHEIFVEKKISLDKYLVGLICVCPNEELIKIKKLLKKLNMGYVKLYTTNDLPSYFELITVV